MGSRRTAGEGSVYQRASDGLWCAAVDLGWTPAGTRRRKVVASRTQAGALAKLREVRRTLAVHGTVPTGAPTLAEWLTAWLEGAAAARVRPRTLATYRHKVALVLATPAARVRLDRLTPAHVRAVHAGIAAAGLSGATALQAHRVLAVALRDAQREGLVARNVATLVDAPRRDARPRAALSAGQARALLAAVADDPLAGRWALALLCGVRQGEALGLTWGCVDLDGGTLDLAWQLQRLPLRHGCARPGADPACGRSRPGSCPAAALAVPRGYEHRPLAGGLALTRPKSAAGVRVLPLLPVMGDALRLRAAAAPPGPDGLVWTRADGRPVDPRADAAAWHAALERAGLPAVPLHAARHTTATLLLEAGVDAHVVASILGHSDVVTTRGYQHASLELARAALGRVEAAVGG